MCATREVHSMDWKAHPDRMVAPSMQKENPGAATDGACAGEAPSATRRTPSAPRTAGRRAALILCAICLLDGCASGRSGAASPAASPPSLLRPPQEQRPPEYRLNVGDELDVLFPYRTEFNQRVTILPDGTVSLPLLNSVPATGRTVEAFRQEVVAGYRTLRVKYDDAQDKEYRIGPGDVLEIRFRLRPDLTDQVTVRPDGRISLALVKSVMATGRTPEELEADLLQRYSAHMNKPDLVVIVRSFSSNRFYLQNQAAQAPIRDLEDVHIVVRSTPSLLVYVGGEVTKPGPLPYRGNLTLIGAVISAGGETRDADLGSIVVLRDAPGSEPLAFVVNIQSAIDGDKGAPFQLKPYDVVVVPKTGVASMRKFLDDYLWNMTPFLRNASVGFNFLYRLNYSGLP